MKSLLLFFALFLAFFSFSQKKDTVFFYFDVNFSTFIQTSTTQKNIDWMNKNEFESIQFFACTDTTGTLKKNQKLAEKRLQNTLNGVEIHTKDISYNTVGESDLFNSLAGNRCVYVVTTELIEKKIQPIVKMEKITLNLSFVLGEYTLLTSSTPILKELFLHLDTISYSKIELHGHVCCGDDERLSYMRAKRVENELVQYGIDVNKITCYGYSNTRPLVPENTDENKQINRRVEVVVFP